MPPYCTLFNKEIRTGVENRVILPRKHTPFAKYTQNLTSIFRCSSLNEILNLLLLLQK